MKFNKSADFYQSYNHYIRQNPMELSSETDTNTLADTQLNPVISRECP